MHSQISNETLKYILTHYLDIHDTEDNDKQSTDQKQRMNTGLKGDKRTQNKECCKESEARFGCELQRCDGCEKWPTPVVGPQTEGESLQNIKGQKSTKCTNRGYEYLKNEQRN